MLINVPFRNYIVIYFLSGRCGSTLFCKALDQFSTVQSISEPSIASGGSYIVYWLLSSLRLDAFYMWWIFKFRRHKRNYWFYEYLTASRQENNPFRAGFYWCFGYLWWINVHKALSLVKKMPNFFNAVLKYDDLVTRKQQLVLQVASAIGLMDDERLRSKTELDDFYCIYIKQSEW